MNIAIVGWGSLIWDPGTLAKRGRWHKDGPCLPIEFVRVSKDRRLTLVIHPPSNEQRTYWALSALERLKAARTNLARREGTGVDNIRRVSREESCYGADAIEVAVHRWLRGRPDLDAAIWTGLPATLKGRDVVAEAVTYLTGLESIPDVYERAKEYVVKAPRQIQTAARREMQRQGWVDVELPQELFES
jgi:hypothetical protein